MTRAAQWWLAENGFTNIENDTIRLNEIRILLSNRAIEYINEQAREAGVVVRAVGSGER